jgi:cytidyltransferase-like protein
MIIYCDGIFDLFHSGHLLHLKRIHDYFNEPIKLLVGVISDSIAESYKRTPIFNEIQRHKILNSCIYVTETFITDILIVDEEFLLKYNIDFVVHAFNDSSDKSKQHLFYEIPIKLHKFIEISYNDGISTTQIINENNLDWNQIWNRKGNENIDDLYILNGWESTNFDPKILIDNIMDKLNILDKSYILEMGCGAGLLAYYLSEHDYIGVDYSITLVTKHINILGNIVLNFNSNETLFKDNFFDYTIINSVLEYLQHMDDVNKTMEEIERVSKKGIYIGNIRCNTHNIKLDKHKFPGVFEHITIDKKYFIDRGYIIMDSLYDNINRYDAVKIFNK